MNEEFTLLWEKWVQGEIPYEKSSQVLLSLVFTKVSQGATGNVNYLTAVNDEINGLTSDLNHIQLTLPTLGWFQFDRPIWKISQAREVGVASDCLLTTFSKQKPNNTTRSLAGADLFKDSPMLF